MSFEYSTFPSDDFELMRIERILETGYGKKFDQQKVEQLFKRATGVVEVKSHLGATAGLAILGDQSTEDTRLMMACGLRGHERLARSYYSDLLKICNNEGLASWMSVGPAHHAVQQLCSDAGLRPLDDEDKVRELVYPLHAPEAPILQRDDHGEILVKGVQNPNGLGQHVYVWGPDFTHVSKTSTIGRQ